MSMHSMLRRIVRSGKLSSTQGKQNTCVKTFEATQETGGTEQIVAYRKPQEFLCL